MNEWPIVGDCCHYLKKKPCISSLRRQVQAVVSGSTQLAAFRDSACSSRLTVDASRAMDSTFCCGNLDSIGERGEVRADCYICEVRQTLGE
jgi:hypothetical protein